MMRNPIMTRRYSDALLYLCMYVSSSDRLQSKNGRDNGATVGHVRTGSVERGFCMGTVFAVQAGT